jgi:ABC-2 type transport system ATP-binding protein
MGMRQRLKFASSIIHEPDLLILDEPLRGVDPLWRINIIKILKEFESKGKTVIVSSHILSEVESLTNRVILIHQGKVFAQGDIQEIRGLIDSHPHKISIQCNNPRELAREMIFYDFVKNILFNDKEQKIIIETDNREHFFSKLMETIVKTDSDIREIISPDDNLQAVFDYLIGR